MVVDISKDPINFQIPFQSGEGTCYNIKESVYYNVPHTSMFGGKKSRKLKGGQLYNVNGEMSGPLYSNGVSLKCDKGGKRKQKGGNLGAPEKFSMFGNNDFKSGLNENFSATNMGLTYATQAGGKSKSKKSLKGGVDAATYYTNSLTGSYSPKNIDSNSVPQSDKCGGSKKKKSIKGGYEDVSGYANATNGDSAGGRSVNASLGKANGALPGRGGGIQYRGTDAPNTPANFADGSVWHPEWKYTNGGKGRKLKGGNYIPTPDAVPLSVASSEPAGVQVQMGWQEHLMKAPKTIAGNIAADLIDSAPAHTGENLKKTWNEMTAGSKKTRSRSRSKESKKGGKASRSSSKDSKKGGKISKSKESKKGGSKIKRSSSKTRKLKGGDGSSESSVADLGNRLWSGAQEIAKNVSNEGIQALPGKVGANFETAIKSLQDGGSKKRVQKSKKLHGGNEGLGQQIWGTVGDIAGKLRGEFEGSLPGNVDQNLKAALESAQTGGKKKKSHKGGNELKGAPVNDPGDIDTPGAVPMDIAARVPAGDQLQLYGDMTRMRGPRDIVMPGVGVTGGEAIQAQLGDMVGSMLGGKKKASKKESNKKNRSNKSLKSGGADSSGVGSDWSMSQMSRGPANYPDGPTADRFRYFTKTAEFIPNSMLKWYAAPISTGFQPDPNPYPMAYNSDCMDGGKGKKSRSSKKKTMI